MAFNIAIPVDFSRQESNALIFSFFASGMDGLAFISPDNKVRYANEQFARMVEIPLEKVLGHLIEDLIPGWSRQIEEIFQNVRLLGDEFTLDLSPDFLKNQPERGIVCWKVKIGPVKGADGAFTGWVLILRDATQDRQNEDRIKALSQELDNQKTILNEVNENSLAGLAILDGSTFTYKWANKTIKNFLKPPHQFNGYYGLPFEESIYTEHKNELVDKLREVACTRKPVQDCLLNRGQDYWNCSIFPIKSQTDVPDLMVVFVNITEKIVSRKLLESYSRQASRHLQQLENVIENMNDGVVIFSPNGKILNLNSAALRLLEYSNQQECPAYLDQIKAKFELFGLEGNALPDEAWPSNRILRGEIVRDFEVAVKRTNTAILKYSSFSGTLIKDNHNESIGAVMTIRDISEREMLIRQLEQKQAQLEAVLEQMPCGVIMFDVPNGKTVLTNRRYNELWRVSAAGGEIDEHNWPGKFFHSDGRAYLQTELPIVRTVRQGETIANEEMICRRQDGSWMAVICNSAPVLDREGKVLAGVLVFSDITELKEATTKAALANQLQQIIQFLPDGTFVLDKNRKVIAWNLALEQLTGISNEDIVGTDLYTGIFGDSQVSLIDELFKGITISSDFRTDRSGEVAVREILLPVLNQRKNVLLDLKATPIRDELGEVTGVIETIRDIKQQKQMEAETVRMQKLDSLGILAGGIAHDFNNILAAILANLQLAALKLSKKEDIFKYLDHTIEITRKASDLTRQLLTFAKGGAPVKKTASILDVIKDTVEFALRGSKVKAKFYFPENLWGVEIDEGQINQVISNLTINSVQAMPQGGFIKITLENVVLTAETKYNPGRYVKLSFLDSGCGIPADIIDKIFDPFFTTKEVGNGLGLSTSYSIIKRHNGYIEVDSLVGTGALFYIYLPASERETIFAKIRRDVAVTGKSKILIMDDDEVIRQVVSDMLGYYGYQITIAKDGAEAIKAYQEAMSAGAKFDVVIMDLTVPGGMGGLETMEVLRRSDPGVKAIISSGYANNPVMSDYRRYGFCGFVAKPYKFDELIEVLNTACF